MTPSDPATESLYNLLVGIEAVMRSHYTCFLVALESQRSTVERMQILSQRYNILLKSVPSTRTYPKGSLNSAEDDLKSDFHEKRRLLDESNCKLDSSLAEIREKFCGLHDFMKEMDEGQVSSLQSGDSARPPIAYFVELFSDFLKFFTRQQSKMNCLASFLTPGNIQPLNIYKKLLALDNDFKDHFGKSLAYCSCLHKPKT